MMYHGHQSLYTSITLLANQAKQYVNDQTYSYGGEGGGCLQKLSTLHKIISGPFCTTRGT